MMAKYGGTALHLLTGKMEFVGFSAFKSLHLA
jgi:hypothetical protein